MTISVKVPVNGKDGKPLIDSEGNTVTKSASLSVKKVTLTNKGKEFELGLPASAYEAIGQAVNQSKGVLIDEAKNLIADMPAEAILNVYHAGYDIKTMQANLSASVKTHAMTVKQLRERLVAIAAGSKVMPTAELFGYWKDYPHAKRGRTGGSVDLKTVKIAKVWEV